MTNEVELSEPDVCGAPGCGKVLVHDESKVGRKRRFCDKECSGSEKYRRRAIKIQAARSASKSHDPAVRLAAEAIITKSIDKNRRVQLASQLRIWTAKLEEAQLRLAEVQTEASQYPELQQAVALNKAEQKLDQDAADNAINVSQNRAAQFLMDNRDQIMEILSVWGYNKALRNTDVEAIWSRMMGDPKPIVIAPPPAFDEFSDESDEE